MNEKLKSSQPVVSTRKLQKSDMAETPDRRCAVHAIEKQKELEIIEKNRETEEIVKETDIAQIIAKWTGVPV